jgi:GT2 family glycosyltransferase
MNSAPSYSSSLPADSFQTGASDSHALRLARGDENCPPLNQLPSYEYTISVIVVSFNTCKLLRRCLNSVVAECEAFAAGTTAEVLVVDNASSDLSPDMVERDFADACCPVRVIRSAVNLGFAVANNVAMLQARGRYLVLLNSDALLHPGALWLAIQHMDANSTVGIAGARLVGPRGEWQPSARAFPTIWHLFVVYSGLANRYKNSRVFGAFDRTWTNADVQADVDWVPGAFSIVRREALAETGLFDSRFFLYCEEVDLCRRVKANKYRVLYCPDVVVTHLGGESSKQLTTVKVSEGQSQVELWRMRANLLYFRKHHGWRAWGFRALEDGMHLLRWLRSRKSHDAARRSRAEEARLYLSLMAQAWRETEGGRISPPQPW